MSALPNDPSARRRNDQELPNTGVNQKAKRQPGAIYNGYQVLIENDDGEMADHGSLAFGRNVDRLVQAKAFLYTVDDGRISVRLERKARGSDTGYWVAYKRVAGRLRKTYICEAYALDPWNVDDAAARLLSDD